MSESIYPIQKSQSFIAIPPLLSPQMYMVLQYIKYLFLENKVPAISICRMRNFHHLLSRVGVPPRSWPLPGWRCRWAESRCGMRWGHWRWARLCRWRSRSPYAPIQTYSRNPGFPRSANETNAPETLSCSPEKTTRWCTWVSIDSLVGSCRMSAGLAGGEILYK